MADIIDFSSISKNQVQFIIKHLGMPNGHDYGWIRELFKRAFGTDISGEHIAQIESRNPNKVQKAREEYLSSYTQHKLYQPVVLLDYFQQIIDHGLEAQAYGSSKIPQKTTDEDTGEEKTVMVDVLLTRRDLKVATAAAKTCLDFYIEDTKLKSKPESKGANNSGDGLVGLQLAQTS